MTDGSGAGGRGSGDEGAVPPSKKRKTERKSRQTESKTRKNAKSGEERGRTREKKGRGEGRGGKKGSGKKSAGAVDDGLGSKQKSKVVSKAIISSSDNDSSEEGDKLRIASG